MYINPRYLKTFETSKLELLATDVDIKTIPAPVGGWDAISPLSNMDPIYAVELINWVPRPGYIEVRGGFNIWANTSETAAVNSLLVYRPESGTEKLFAAVGTKIFDVSTYDTPTDTNKAITDSRIQYVNFTPAGGSSYILCVNGSDSYFAYDGSTWTEPSITGATSSNFVNIAVHKRRVWFVEENTANAWFLDTDAIQGEATKFPLGSIFGKGSYLMAIGTWTIDGGNGPDDYIVFISQRGEVALYRGTDPANGAVWALVGTFEIPPPIGRRCFTKAGSELYVVTIEGLLPISKVLPFDPAAARSVALTNRIQNAMLMAAQMGRTNFGWECTPFPAQSLVILNVPIVTNSSQEQFVMNTLNGAWCKFQGWNANCFAIYNESLYFGDNSGKICLAYAGQLDYDQDIPLTVRCAYNYLDAPGRVKNISMIRPFFYADGRISPAIAIDVDFGSDAVAAPVSVLDIPGGVWDESIWDIDTWSTGAQSFADWYSAQAIGTAMSIHLTITLSSQASENGVTTASGVDVPVLQVNAFQVVAQYGAPV